MKENAYKDTKKITEQINFFPFNFLIKKSIFRRPSGIYRTQKSKNKIRDYVQTFPKNSVWLNIGSGSTIYGEEFINMDIAAFANVNLIGDAHNLPLKSNSADGIVIQGVCEHIRRPEIVIKEIHRVLKKGGVVIAEIPFIQGFHADPQDFQRYTTQGLEELFDSFEKVEIGVAVGPASGFVWILREFLSIVFSFNNYYLYKIFRYFFSWLTSPIPYLDFFFERSKFAVTIASSLFFIGKRR